MEITIQNTKYLDQFSSPSKLVTVPKEGQTFEFVSQTELDKRTYTLSKRNGAGFYTIPTNKEQVYLNFIGKKTIVFDNKLKKYIDSEFTYFIPPVVIPPDAFTLPEGQIFRCVSESSTPMPKENYSYYTIVNGKKRKIPNYKTVEVMLAERGQTLLSVRVVPETECNQISQDLSEIPDKQTSWTPEFSDQTNLELLNSLNASVKSGAAIADAAAASAGSQIAAVKAQAEQAKSEADAAKAQSQADKAASEAAIAQAEAAKAEADAAKAEAEAAKAVAESQQNSGN